MIFLIYQNILLWRRHFYCTRPDMYTCCYKTQNELNMGKCYHMDFDMLKKSFLFGKRCLYLHLDRLKFDLSSWVIPSVPVVKLKHSSFQFWRSHRKQTKHSGDIAIFFTVIFMILVECKCILQKWYSFTYSLN